VKIGYDNNGGKKVEFKWTPIKLINNRPETLYLDNDIEYLNRVDYIFTNGYDFKDVRKTALNLNAFGIVFSVKVHFDLF
jgi:hypothetical protein